jgi:hypothetical protein
MVYFRVVKFGAFVEKTSFVMTGEAAIDFTEESKHCY